MHHFACSHVLPVYRYLFFIHCVPYASLWENGQTEVHVCSPGCSQRIPCRARRLPARDTRQTLPSSGILFCKGVHWYSLSAWYCCGLELILFCWVMVLKPWQWCIIINEWSVKPWRLKWSRVSGKVYVAQSCCLFVCLFDLDAACCSVWCG